MLQPITPESARTRTKNQSSVSNPASNELATSSSVSVPAAVMTKARGNPSPITRLTWALVGIGSSQDSTERQQEDLEIEPQRPVVDVHEVECNPVPELCRSSRGATRTVDL